MKPPISDPDKPLLRLPQLNGEIEQAIAKMYETANPTAAYADAKDFLAEAIGLARKLGLKEEIARFEARLAEVKNIFRNQFPP